jgi:Predicted permeases
VRPRYVSGLSDKKLESLDQSLLFQLKNERYVYAFLIFIMVSAGLQESFLSAIQASLSVLLVVFYGGLAAFLGFIDRINTKPISKICVRMFLPALLITKVGSQLHAASAHRYVIIFVWAIICHLISFFVGTAANFALGMPDWATVAILVNNTTSYPLLLITALEDTGVLESLVVTDETTKEAIERAKSYFLIFSTVSNCITFAVGPRLIDSENPPEEDEGDKPPHIPNGIRHSAAATDLESNEVTGLLSDERPPARPSPHPVRNSSFFILSRRIQPAPKADPRRPWMIPRKRWNSLSARTKWWFLLIADFFNAPLLGAIIGVILGLIPALHRAFFNPTEDGGIFTAWLTESLKTIGGLFVTLPVVVAGVSLFCSTREARRHHESAICLPWGTVAFILLVRFVAWPAVSISIIYLLAAKTTFLGSDPILWFALMMMPAGPSAMKLITLVQVADGSKEDEVHITRLLTVRAPLRSLPSRSL